MKENLKSSFCLKKILVKIIDSMSHIHIRCEERYIYLVRDEK